MGSLIRSLNPLTRSQPSSLCAQCRRTFISSPILTSGHNKWSKIRHDKAAADVKKATERNILTKNIVFQCRVFGSDPAQNPGLVAAINAAKKASVPKDKIEAALARGQGKSSSGETLESFLFEAVVPPSIALIVDCETESKARLMQDLNKLVKTADGSASSTKFFFTRLGRVTFEKSPKITDIDQIMDDAIEAGAEDLQNDAEGNIVIWTQPTGTSQIVEAIGSKFGLKALSADIFWIPNEDTKAKLDKSEEAIKFTTLLESLANYPDVQAVYSNVGRGSGLSDEAWQQIAENINQV
ncbi:transcriptional regulator TACO1-like protein [Podospora fimiseda]|uniref:Transcriptional regulator TACO1-like protein n=1 Tax=Podospora fimiseda TaxID=252190 RepID=A0AAN7BYL4_9PEZI|nr:transcriptional regulator TACO1-like protein [Podospora fimiseda]